MNRMLIILPSYRRPEMLKEFVKSYNKTKANDPKFPHGWSDLIVGLSANDPTIPEYIKLSKEFNFKIQIEETNSTTVIFNKIWKENPQYYCYHMQNDDVILQTEGWDFVFIDVLLQQGGGIVYGDDGFHGAGLCTLPCISSNVLNITGWLQYSALDKLFGDAVWMHLGNQTPCIYWHHQIHMEHKHWINGKREVDSTAEEYLVGYKKDEFIYNFYINNFAKSDVQKLRKLFTEKQLISR